MTKSFNPELTLIQESIIKNRQIYLWNDITNQLSLRTIKTLDYYVSLNNEPISILINSYGGSLDDAQGIVDEIEKTKKKTVVKTYNKSRAFSAAAYIFAAGTKGHRYVAKSSTVMLHPCSVEFPSDYEEVQAKAHSFYQKKMNQFYRDLLSYCKNQISLDQFIQDISSGLWLSAKNAIKFGIADKME